VTVEDAREYLPSVKVKFDGKLYLCQVTGRLNRFPTVTIRRPGKEMIQFDTSWEQIARMATTGGVINYC